MTKDDLNNILHTHVPLCAFMEVIVKELTEKSITAFAPLEANKNMHGTGFAGSLYALAVATGWGLVYSRLDSIDFDTQLVIKEASIRYKRPVTGDITLTAQLPDTLTTESIEAQLNAEKKAAFPLLINILSKGKKCAALTADYVAVIQRS